MQNETMGVFLFAGCLLLLTISIWLLRRPIFLLLRLAVKVAGGTLALLFINTFCGAWGIYVGINPLTMLLCGILGIPGIGALFMLRFLQ